MNQQKTGALIRRLRQHRGMTQRMLAEEICVSDKTVSKWERGCGVPDVGLLPPLAAALGIDTETLLRGEWNENDRSNGDMKRIRFYVCPSCGNLLFSSDGAELACCGRKLSPLLPKKPDEENSLTIQKSDGQWFVTSAHPMTRAQYVSFLTFLNGDTLLVRKLYPEWNLETNLPFFAHGMLLWYCTQDGLFEQRV